MAAIYSLSISGSSDEKCAAIYERVLDTVPGAKDAFEHGRYFTWCSYAVQMARFSKSYPTLVFAVVVDDDDGKFIHYFQNGQGQEFDPVETWPDPDPGAWKPITGSGS